MHAAKSILLAGILAATASSVLAAPTQRDAPSISCTKIPKKYSKTLLLKHNYKDFAAYNVAFDGQRDNAGRQILVTGAPDPVAEQDFDFWACDSKTLGFKASTKEGYWGQLRPSNAPHHCVTVAPGLQPTNGRFVSETCSTVDDDSQLNQFFSMTLDGGLVQFLGAHNGSSQGKYDLEVGETAHKKVQVNYITSDSQQQGYGYSLGFLTKSV